MIWKLAEMSERIVERTVKVILREPPFKDDNERNGTYNIALSDQVRIRYPWFSFLKLFIFILGCLRNWLAYLLFLRNNVETIKNKHFSRQKNEGIFHLWLN